MVLAEFYDNTLTDLSGEAFGLDSLYIVMYYRTPSAVTTPMERPVLQIYNS